MLRSHNAGSPMRDIFEEIFENQPLDPKESARRSMRPQSAGAVLSGGDGRRGARWISGAARWQAGADPGAAAPRRAGARAGAGAGRRMGGAERQGRSGGDAADAARQLDHRWRRAPRPRRSRPRSKNISAPTCVFYRAEAPEGLVARQAQAWDPVLDWARETLGARFVLARGRRARAAAARSDRRRGGGDPDGADIGRLGGSARSTSSPR